ncbi:MAG: hypothetical protein WA326_04260, partial [Nitrososphaeraceae archaeon]
MPVSRVHNISPNTAFAQQLTGSIPTTTPTTEAATVTPASEIGTTMRPSSIVLMNIEDLRATDKTGDAEADPNSLKISSAFNDEESGHTIQYTPAAIGFAGIAYKADKNYDLSNAQRVVFFAKGQNGGENVTFAAVGRNENTAAFNNTDETLGSAFNNQNFSLISEDVSLDRDWKRYQISLEGVDLQRISHPFAFIVHRGLGPESVTFSLRDITYDSKPATDPLDTVEQPENQTTNQTGLPAITSDSQANDTSVSNATQGSSPTTDPEELATNTTDTLPLNTTNTLPSAEEINTNSTSGESGSLTNNETRAAHNPGEQGVTVNNSSSLIDSTLPLFPNATATTDSPQSNNITNTDTVNADPNNIGSNIWNDNTQQPNAPDNAISSAPSLVSSLPANLSASNLTLAQPVPVESGIVTTDILTNSPANVPPGSSSFLPSSPLSGPLLDSLLPSEAFRPTFSDTTPPDTVIPLVTDSSTGSALQNGGISDSESPLSFTFDGLDETSNSIAGYQCSIDGSTGYYCTSPITLDNNYLGTGTEGVTSTTPPNNVHSFQVSAVDAAGNVDPSPATFEWSVPGGANIQDTSAQDTIAPDTTIVSVVDSNNATVLNGSSVSLTSPSLQSPIAIQFANQSSAANTQSSAANTFTISFAATDNTNLIEGYQCASYWSSSVPEQIEFTRCTNPSISELSAESSMTASETSLNTTNIFQVRAVDATGNVDPSPATFLLNIIPGPGLEDAGMTETQQPQQQFPQDPLLQQQQQQPQQQFPQDPLLQQQQQPQQQFPQDPLLQQQQP